MSCIELHGGKTNYMHIINILIELAKLLSEQNEHLLSCLIKQMQQVNIIKLPTHKTDTVR
jgi:hypothetical protein